MDSHVHEQSLIYPLISAASELFHVIGIPLVFIAICIWSYQKRTKLSYIAVLGMSLVLSGHIVRMIVPEVHSIVMSGLQPAEGQNAFVHFLYLHGNNYGFTLLGLGLILSLSNEKSL